MKVPYNYFYKVVQSVGNLPKLIGQLAQRAATGPLEYFSMAGEAAGPARISLGSQQSNHSLVVLRLHYPIWFI